MQAAVERANQKAQQVSALQAEIKQLQAVSAEIKKRDTTIESLQGQLRSQTRAKDDEIAHLQNQLQTQHSRQEKIEALAARLAKIEHLPQTLAEREQEINRLQAQLDRVEQEKNQELSALSAEIKRRDATIEDLRKQLVDAKSRPKPAATRAQPVKRPARKPLSAPPREKDDLKRIYGIGPVMERLLNELGVTSFEQIARFTSKDLERVAAALQSFPDRIRRDDWIGGAKKEYHKKYGKTI